MKPELTKLEKFYNKLIRHENDRFRSFEHCYKYFSSLNGKLTSKNQESAMLHLGFYLASWGMYRGSSFLLQKDYKIYAPIIKILFKKKYNDLWHIEKNLNEKNKFVLRDLCFDLHDKLKIQFEEERIEYFKFIDKKPPKQDVSSILTTKVMMGTLGCVPAYDRFFKDGIKYFNKKNSKHLVQNFSKKSLLEIYEFLLENKNELINLQEKIKIKTKFQYPLLKLIDSYFWWISFERNKSMSLN